MLQVIWEKASNPGNYIAKSYFERHDIFEYSLFNNYMANDIPLGLSIVVQDKSFLLPAASVLHRNIMGEGSHCHLSSSIRLNMQPDLKSKLAEDSYGVVIIERLPSGVLADPFELQHLVHRGVFTDAAIFGDTNLEQPSFRSNQSVIEIQMALTFTLPMYEEDFQVNLELPIHARYPSLGRGYSRVEFRRPDLLLCCYIEKESGSSCLPTPIEHNAHIDNHPVAWEIPCVIKEHAGVVSAVTFVFAMVAAVIIVLASICYSDNSPFNKLKNS